MKMFGLDLPYCTGKHTHTHTLTHTHRLTHICRWSCWVLSIWAFCALQWGGCSQDCPSSYNVFMCVMYCVCTCAITTKKKNTATKVNTNIFFFAHLHPSSACRHQQLSWYPECRWWSTRSRPSHWSPPTLVWQPRTSLQADHRTAQSVRSQDKYQGEEYPYISVLMCNARELPWENVWVSSRSSKMQRNLLTIRDEGWQRFETLTFDWNTFSVSPYNIFWFKK